MEDLPGPLPVVVVVCRGPGFQFQGMIVIAILEEIFEVEEHKRDNSQGLPLSDVGQFVGQERFGHFDPPTDENEVSPDLGLSPAGDEPGDNDETDRRLGH